MRGIGWTSSLVYTYTDGIANDAVMVDGVRGSVLQQHPVVLMVIRRGSFRARS